MEIILTKEEDDKQELTRAVQKIMKKTKGRPT